MWNQWTTPRIMLSRAAYVMILQGTSPQRFFDDNCWIDGPMGHTMGPFFYLRGDARSLYSAIPEIRNVVLAQVIEGASLAVPELLGILVSRVLTQS